MRRRDLVRKAMGTVTLIYAVYSVVCLPFDFRSRPITDVMSAEGRLAWLVGLGHPWQVLAHVTDVIEAAGLLTVAIGLLLARARLLRIGLAALVPPLAVQLLLVPGAVALLCGYASIRLVGSPPARVVREGTLTVGVAWLVMAAVFTLYVIWLWRELRRLVAEAGAG